MAILSRKNQTTAPLQHFIAGLVRAEFTIRAKN